MNKTFEKEMEKKRKGKKEEIEVEKKGKTEVINEGTCMDCILVLSRNIIWNEPMQNMMNI